MLTATIKKASVCVIIICIAVACSKASDDKVTALPIAKVGQPANNTKSNQKPNIFLLVLEDLSPRIGAYGDKVAMTPNIDQFARESVVFNNAFTTAGVCSPSRSSLITGVHQQTLGTMHMRTSAFGVMTKEGHPYEAVIPAQIKAFPELMRQEGYFTINDDKTDYQFGDPFTVWNLNAKDSAWQALPNNKPVFAMVNFFTTHEGYTWPPNDTYEHDLAERTRRRNEQFDKTKSVRTDPSKVVIPPYYPNEETIAQNIARHYDNIAATDDIIGRFLSQLEDQDLLSNSIVILTSDHGDGLPRAKRSVYDSGIAVPLIVRFPDKHNAGLIRNDLVSFVDIAPTILSLAGAEIPDWIQGRIFIGPQQQSAPDTVFAAADRNGQSGGRIKAARSAQFKYIRNYQPQGPRLPPVAYQNVNPIMQVLRAQFTNKELIPEASQYFESPSPAEELYDLEVDPHEVNNLSETTAHKHALARMRAKMDEWIAKTGDLSAVSELDMVAAMWPNSIQPTTAAPIACRAQGNDAIELSSPTRNASIGYRYPTSEDASWQLYSASNMPYLIQTRSVKADNAATSIKGINSIEVKAIRYGYQESASVVYLTDEIQACRAQ